MSQIVVCGVRRPVVRTPGTSIVLGQPGLSNASGWRALIDQTAIMLASKPSALNALLVNHRGPRSRASPARHRMCYPAADRLIALMMLRYDPTRHNAHGRVFGKTLSVDSSTAAG
jgi:hypothetical protein